MTHRSAVTTQSVITLAALAVGLFSIPVGAGSIDTVALEDVVSRSLPNVQVTPVLEASTKGAGGGGGICPPETQTYASNNFEGNFIGTIPPGMVETEIAAVSFTLPPTDFPVQLSMAEMIFSQTHFNPTTTEWSILVWEGNPNNGNLIEVFSSDDVILPHVNLPIGGARAVNLQFSVDPGDPDQIVIQNNGSNTFSVGFRIDAHNSPPTTSCVQDLVCNLPAVCCPPDPNQNAWPSMDSGTTGPDAPTNNWLFARDCPGAPFPGVCFVDGWIQLGAIPPQFANDWAMRITWISLNGCAPNSGACCTSSDECIITTSGDCAGMGGSFLGSGVPCTPTACGAAEGACCLDLAAGCIDLVAQEDCEDSNGVFFLATGCDSLDCTQGACCIPTTGGCLTQPEASCNVIPGLYQGNGTECPFLCFPIGACCLPSGACAEDQSPQDCESVGGVFQGDGVPCSKVTCPLPEGACCFGGGCLSFTDPDCDTGGGAWQGAGTVCPTACEEPPCPEDLDLSGSVDFGDLLRVLSAWGTCTCDEDLDGSGAADFGDVLRILSSWGPC